MKTKSKTSKINYTREKLLRAFSEYAFCAQGWEPQKEGDYDDLVEYINRILEEVMT